LFQLGIRALSSSAKADDPVIAAKAGEYWMTRCRGHDAWVVLKGATSRATTFRNASLQTPSRGDYLTRQGHIRRISGHGGILACH
jgi:hypothetical protein